MILDVEKAFKDYFVTNMTELTGSGNSTITIYKERFPDNSDAEGVRVFMEVAGTPTVFQLYPVMVRIDVRARKKSNAFKIMQNVDYLIDRRANTDLNSDINLGYCHRNSGPSPFMDRHLHYYTALYNVEVRQIDG